MGFDMKEYLRKNSNGKYIAEVTDEREASEPHAADWIEIPEGAFSLKGNFIFFNQDGSKFYSSTGEWKNTPMMNRLNILWQRESLNDKLASAEQYRQAEVLPFIDDESENIDLASGCDSDELAKEYVFRGRDMGESCLSYREPLEIFIERGQKVDDEPDFKKLEDLLIETTKHKPAAREWDLSDYDFAESDAWIESNVEQDKEKHSHYKKDISHLDTLDIYRITELFNPHSCGAHIAKKALCSGQRGHKDLLTDIQDIIDTAERWKEMLIEDEIFDETEMPF